MILIDDINKPPLSGLMLALYHPEGKPIGPGRSPSPHEKRLYDLIRKKRNKQYIHFILIIIDMLEKIYVI